MHTYSPLCKIYTDLRRILPGNARGRASPPALSTPPNARSPSRLAGVASCSCAGLIQLEPECPSVLYIGHCHTHTANYSGIKPYQKYSSSDLSDGAGTPGSSTQTTMAKACVIFKIAFKTCKRLPVQCVSHIEGVYVSWETVTAH